MLISPANDKAILPKLWRLLLFSTGAVFLSAVLLFVKILRNPEWHEHLLRLMVRAWSVFVAQDVGSTSRGFISGSLEAIFGIAAVAAMTGYLLGWKEFKKHLIETAIIALFAFATVTVVIYGTQFVWEIVKAAYIDHKMLAYDNLKLRNRMSGLVDPSSKDSQIANLKKKLDGTDKPSISFEQIPLDPNVGMGKPDIVRNPGVEAIVTARTIVQVIYLEAACDRSCNFASYSGVDSSALATVTAIAGNDRLYKIRFAMPAILNIGKQVTIDFHSKDDKPIKLQYVHLLPVHETSRQ